MRADAPPLPPQPHDAADQLLLAPFDEIHKHQLDFFARPPHTLIDPAPPLPPAIVPHLALGDNLTPAHLLLSRLLSGPGLDVFGVGASGAIFGLMGAYVVVGKKLRADITQILGLIAINVVIGFVAGGVDWRAHLGGLATGAAVAAVFDQLPPGAAVILPDDCYQGVAGLAAAGAANTALWVEARRPSGRTSTVSFSSGL